MLPTPIQNTGQDDSIDKDRQQKGTGFTNIDSILNANQGAGAKIGQAVGNNLAGQASDVKAGIQASQDQFNTQAGTANQNANTAIDAGKSYVRNAGESTDDYSNRLTANPTTDWTSVGNNLNNAAYTGPTGLSNANQLTSQAANVAALGQLAGTSGGQSQLLNQVVQRGNYSQGQNALDSLLLGQGGQQFVKQGQTQANQVGQAANNAVSNATAQANGYVSAINNNKAQTKQDINSSIYGTGTVDPTANPNGITGLYTDATKQATDYEGQEARLKALMTGVDASSNKIVSTGTGTAGDTGSVLSDTDRALIQNSGAMGLQNLNVYNDPSNTNAYLGALNSIAGSGTVSQGGQYFKGNQAAAATNLAKLLGDTSTQSQIAAAIDPNTGFKTRMFDNNGSQQNILNSLHQGVDEQIGKNNSLASQLQAMAGNFQPGENVQQLQSGNTGAATLGMSAGTANTIFNGLMNNYNTITGGKNFNADYAGASDKNINDFLNSKAGTYSQNATNLQSGIDSNSKDMYDSILQRLAGNT